MLRALAIATALLTPVAALAAGAPPQPETAPYVDLAPVALPVVVNGKVINYIFVGVRLDLASSANMVKLRDREPYFRDALIRAAHRTPFTDKADYTRIDEAALKAAILRDSAKLAGPGAIKSVTIMNQAPKTTRVPKAAG